MVERRSVYVGGFGEEVSEEILHAAFIPFGEIVRVSIPLNDRTQHHRHFAFVEFEDPEDAQAAVDNMNNAELFGKVLKATLARQSSIVDSAGKAAWDNPEYFAKDVEMDEDVDGGEPSTL